ncbi:MAG TPA: pitrilysin family protein [Longimicrobiales bacterium]|nr:pitrilysin family protein [Longimicrobiales bacterium]
MRRTLAIAFAALALAQPAGAQNVPIEYYKLDNGLKVVLSQDASTPVVAVGVYYDIGFRIEPRDRTGFAHLFEHMMFQGSKNLGKNQFIQLIESSGGQLNGSTRFDFTNYYEVVPAHALERTIWAEADRMRGLDITQENLTNQQGVVKNEVKVNVLNQPYGGFPWIDMPMAANTNWYNAHNFYGELEDLDAATLEDVQKFFRQYYAPNNAVFVLNGNFDKTQAKQWIQQYFGVLPRVELAAQPDITEPRQNEPREKVRHDPKANRPALAVGYHAPRQMTPEYFAMGLVDQILVQGRDSRLYQRLVQEKGMTAGIGASMNGLGNMFNIKGPTIYTLSLIHDNDKPADSIIKEIEAEITRLQNEPVSQAELDRALTKMRSQLYTMWESFVGFGRADMLASFALFYDDPQWINRLEAEFKKVTPAMIQQVAKEYLRTTNRTVVKVTNQPVS